jgi:hypothetical protein
MRDVSMYLFFVCSDLRATFQEVVDSCNASS